jgi:hypothetical protein
VGAHARRPDEGVRLEATTVGEDEAVLFDGLERRPDADVDPAPSELPGGVLAEPGRDLGKDRRGGVDEHPALPRCPEARVVAQRVAHEVGELGERLDARVACADEDEGEVALGARRVERRVGRLELAQDVVAQVDRVGEVLEAEAVLGEPGIGSVRGTEPRASTSCS